MNQSLAVFNDLALEVGGLPVDSRLAAVLVLSGRARASHPLLVSLAEAAVPPRITQWVRGAGSKAQWWAWAHGVVLWVALDLGSSPEHVYTWAPAGWSVWGWGYPTDEIRPPQYANSRVTPNSAGRAWRSFDVEPFIRTEEP